MNQTENIKSATYKDFNVELTRSGTLRVEHYRHDDDPAKGSNEVKAVLQRFKIRWGVQSINGSQDSHSGGFASASVGIATMPNIKDIIKYASPGLEKAITDAAAEWAENLEDDAPRWAEIHGDKIVLIYDNAEGEPEVQKTLDDLALSGFWSWAVATDAFENF